MGLAKRILAGPGLLAAAAMVLGLAGCATISVQTQPYLGSPRYAPTQPAAVQILAAEPKQPKERLGEIRLSIEGNPSRDDMEDKLKTAAARLGADAVFVVYDKTHIFPIVYYDWWGPGWVSEDPHRHIVAVAIKYK
jgi:hypothetical protein